MNFYTLISRRSRSHSIKKTMSEENFGFWNKLFRKRNVNRFQMLFKSLGAYLQHFSINPFISCVKRVLITYFHLWMKWNLNKGESSFTLFYIRWINDLFKNKAKIMSILKCQHIAKFKKYWSKKKGRWTGGKKEN